MEETGDSQSREAQGDGPRMSTGRPCTCQGGQPGQTGAGQRPWETFLQENEKDRNHDVPGHARKRFRQLPEFGMEFVINTQKTKQVNKHDN